MDQSSSSSFLLPTPPIYQQPPTLALPPSKVKQIVVNTSPLCTQLRSLHDYMSNPYFQGTLRLHGSETCLMLVYSTTGNPVVVVAEIGEDSIVVISRRNKNNKKFKQYNRRMPYEIRANLIGIRAIFAKSMDESGTSYTWVKKESELIGFTNEVTKEQMIVPYTLNAWLEVKPNEFFSSYRQLDYDFEKSPGRRSYVIWPNHLDFYNMVLLNERLTQYDVTSITQLIASEKNLLFSNQYETSIDSDDNESNYDNSKVLNSTELNAEAEEVTDDDVEQDQLTDDDLDDGVGVFDKFDEMQMSSMLKNVKNQLKIAGVDELD